LGRAQQIEAEQQTYKIPRSTPLFSSTELCIPNL
jgi:hypothetical protein